VLGRGIINGGPTVVGVVSEVVGVDSGGTPYWRSRVCKKISSLLVRRMLRSTRFPGCMGPGF
jgi:hypothetical protein